MKHVTVSIRWIFSTKSSVVCGVLFLRSLPELFIFGVFESLRDVGYHVRHIIFAIIKLSLVSFALFSVFILLEKVVRLELTDMVKKCIGKTTHVTIPKKEDTFPLEDYGTRMIDFDWLWGFVINSFAFGCRKKRVK